MSDQLTVVVTTTFYGSVKELRFRLACETILKAVAAGYPIIVVDGSPVPEVAEAFRELGALVFPELYRGIGPSRRQAFYHAIRLASENGSGCKIVWTEPEKHDLIRSLPEILAPLDDGFLAVIARRDPASWKTYPGFQADSEMEANAAYADLTGRKGCDPMFGPVALRISPEIERLVLFMNPSKFGASDTYIQHLIPLLIPPDLVASVEVNFAYPSGQRAQEEEADNEVIREKRHWQRKTLIEDYRIFGHMGIRPR